MHHQGDPAVRLRDEEFDDLNDDHCEDGDDSEQTWSRREAARRRQIMIGKARPEYKRYLDEVPVDQRDESQPCTPDPRARVSKRQFDRALGDWRRRLHEYDAVPSFEADLKRVAEFAATPLTPAPAEPVKAFAPLPPLPCPPQAPPSSSGQSPSSSQKRTQRRQRGGRGGSSSESSASGSTIQAPATVVPHEPGAIGQVVQLRLADQLLEKKGPKSVYDSSPPWAVSYDGAPLMASGVDPETPCRPDRQVPWQVDRSTPSPLAPQALEYRLGLAQTEHIDYKTLVTPQRLQTIYGDGEAEESYTEPPACGSHATRRWKSPPAMPASSLQGSPKTPTRSRISGRSPPSSAIKTPTRGLWVSETPSPDRLHHHMLGSMQGSAAVMQPMGPPEVLHQWPPMGQILEVGWTDHQPYQAWPYA